MFCSSSQGAARLSRPAPDDSRDYFSSSAWTSLAALLRRTAQALIQCALRGMVFIHLPTLGVQLMIAQAKRNLPLLTIHLDDLRCHLILQLELLFEFRRFDLDPPR